MSIKVEHISKHYGPQKALNDVSFELNRGEIVGFLGPNGAGKSTMMKILSGYVPPTFGNAFVNGFDVMDQALEVKSCVGYLPENNPLYLEMYVEEYLNFVGGLYKIKNKINRVAEVVEMVGLAPEKHKKIGALSKGYRQRVGLAQAIVHNPQILILDEPTSGLDPNQLVEIRSLIKSLGKEKTVMLSTHIMQEVEAICNRVIIINKGEIVTDQATRDITNMAASKRLIVSFNSLVNREKLMQIQGVRDVIQKDDNTWEFVGEINEQLKSATFQFAVKENIEILSLSTKSESLEDIFKQFTTS